MSDPPISDIDLENKMALVWTILKIQNNWQKIWSKVRQILMSETIKAGRRFYFWLDEFHNMRKI